MTETVYYDVRTTCWIGGQPFVCETITEFEEVKHEVGVSAN